jgi:hypothetical protein
MNAKLKKKNPNLILTLLYQEKQTEQPERKAKKKALEAGRF